MYQTILVPIDIAHAEASKTVIDTALTNAAGGARIVLLNVVEEIPKWATVELPEGIQEKSFKSSQAELDRIAKTASADVEAEVRIGHPYHTILDVAEEKNVDLIVIASHKPGLQDYLLGSTAAKVVRHAKCSVLVVR